MSRRDWSFSPLEMLEAREVPAISVLTGGVGELSRVVVLDTATLTPLADFLAFGPTFRGGVNAAVGDVNLDGINDLVIGAGRGGGPRVRVVDGRAFIASALFPQAPRDGGLLGANTQIADFFAFETQQRGGTFVTAGHFFGSGHAEVIIGAGVGGAPRVRVFDGAVITALNLGFTAFSIGVVADFFAFSPLSRNGAVVSLATDSGFFLAVSSGPGGDSRVRLFDPLEIAVEQRAFVPNTILADFFTGDFFTNRGSSVSTIDFNRDFVPDLVVLNTGTVTIFSGSEIREDGLNFTGRQADDVLLTFLIPRGGLAGGAFSNFDASLVAGFGDLNRFDNFGGFNNLFGQPALPPPQFTEASQQSPVLNGAFVG